MEGTARGRELGAKLRARREAAGWGTRELARKLGWSHSAVSQIESGKRGPSEAKLAIYLATLGITTGAELDELLALSRQVDDGYHLTRHGDQLPDALLVLIVHETKASTIAAYEPNLVPGLLQTEDYMRALFRRGGQASAETAELWVQARLARQDLLKRADPPRFDVVIHEQALRLPVGGAQVMHEQLLQLVFASDRRRIGIRVLPTQAGEHGGTISSFRLMSYPQNDPVVYVPTDTVSLYLEKPREINFYQGVLNRLAQVTLDEEQSKQFLAELASEYDRLEASHHHGQPGDAVANQ